ncbi:MAG: ribosome maturation factor RimM [Candidatus Izemoplasmatales bacterium]
MEYFKIGEIAAMRGLKGEFKIKSLTNMQRERFKVGNKLFILENNIYKQLIISSYRVINENDYLSFEGYDDINKIEKYRGFDLFIEANQTVELADNEFFIEDLVGLKVYQSNVLKGIVKDIISYPQGDYLEIETVDGDRLIPFRDEFIESQDKEKIIIIEMEGLL